MFLPCTELSRVLQLGYQQLINFFPSYLTQQLVCMLFTLNLIYLASPGELKVITQALQSYAIYPFCRGQNKNLVTSTPFPSCTPKLELITLFHNIQTFILKWKPSSFDAFLVIVSCLIKKNSETLKILSISQDFLKLQKGAGEDSGSKRAISRIIYCSHTWLTHTRLSFKGFIKFHMVQR